MKTNDLSFAGVVLAGALLCLPALAGEVRAAVAVVNSTKGHVICGIFRFAEGFPKETQRAFKLLSLPANPAGVLCAFSDLPAGAYAISVFHDENDDGILNTNFVGIRLILLRSICETLSRRVLPTPYTMRGLNSDGIREKQWHPWVSTDAARP